MEHLGVQLCVAARLALVKQPVIDQFAEVDWSEAVTHWGNLRSLQSRQHLRNVAYVAYLVGIFFSPHYYPVLALSLPLSLSRKDWLRVGYIGYISQVLPLLLLFEQTYQCKTGNCCRNRHGMKHFHGVKVIARHETPEVLAGS
jgi:hypothetical protein